MHVKGITQSHMHDMDIHFTYLVNESRNRVICGCPTHFILVVRALYEGEICVCCVCEGGRE